MKFNLITTTTILTLALTASSALAEPPRPPAPTLAAPAGIYTAPVAVISDGTKYINTLTLEQGGRIKFSLYKYGQSGALQNCNNEPPVEMFSIKECTSSNLEYKAICIAHNDRLANLLIQAKMANRAIHIKNTQCTVTAVSLKP